MSRHKLDENEKKREKVTVRYRSREMDELLLQADLCGLSLSELVRRRSLKLPVIPKTDLKMISELRRLGGLIKRFFTETGGIYRGKTSPLLDEWREAIIRVGKGGE